MLQKIDSSSFFFTVIKVVSVVFLISLYFLPVLLQARGSISVEEFVDGPQDCTKYEKYDPEREVCYFDCFSEKECEEIGKKVDAEIEKMEDKNFGTIHINKNQFLNFTLAVVTSLTLIFLSTKKIFGFRSVVLSVASVSLGFASYLFFSIEPFEFTNPLPLFSLLFLFFIYSLLFLYELKCFTKNILPLFISPFVVACFILLLQIHDINSDQNYDIYIIQMILVFYLFFTITLCFKLYRFRNILTNNISQQILLAFLLAFLYIIFLKQSENILQLNSVSDLSVFSGTLFAFVLAFPNLKRPFIKSEKYFKNELLISDMRKKQEIIQYSILEITHGLLSPLTNLRIKLETLSHECESKKEVRELLNIIEGISQKIYDLLNLLRMRIPERNEKNNRIDLTLLIEQEMAKLCAFAEKEGVTLFFDASGREHFFIFARRYDIEILLFNIIENAIKYTALSNNNKKEVRIELRRRNSNISIYVKDTGIGIKKEDIPKLFDTFYRVVHHSASSGSGVGLALSKQIMENHNGKIMVQSEFGKWTKVIISFPIKK